MDRLTAYLADPIVAGDAVGQALVSDRPLSLWGGLDVDTGEVIDRRHPLSGQIVTGRVLSIPAGRGSCSASGVLLEAIRGGTGPVAIVLSQPDPIISLGAILAEELYGVVVPVVVLPEPERGSIADGDTVSITRDGSILVDRQPLPSDTPRSSALSPTIN